MAVALVVLGLRADRTPQMSQPADVQSPKPDSLRCAPRGTRLTIASVASQSSASIRLRELGLGRGRSVRVVQPSDPLMCVVGDSVRIGMERALAEQVSVVSETALPDARIAIGA